MSEPVKNSWPMRRPERQIAPLGPIERYPLLFRAPVLAECLRDLAGARVASGVLAKYRQRARRPFRWEGSCGAEDAAPSPRRCGSTGTCCRTWGGGLRQSSTRPI